MGVSDSIDLLSKEDIREKIDIQLEARKVIKRLQ